MGIRRCVVKWFNVSLLPEDTYQNTFHFSKPGGAITAGESDAIDAALDSFYNEVHAPGASSLTSYYSNQVSRLEGVIVHYDLNPGGPGEEDDSAGSPVRTTPILPDAAAEDSAMPEEVALCLSYRGDVSSVAEVVPAGPPGPEGDAHPRARRRGRIYLGPFNMLAITDASGLPKAGLINDAIGAGEYLDDPATLPFGIQWAIYSRVDGVARVVTDGWVDNAWDTQRRRGVAPTARTTFS